MIALPGQPEHIQALREIYNGMEPDVFYKNHWELSKLTKHTPQEWKEFLMLPAVAEYIDQELNILIETEKRAILKDISKNQRSVGTSQMLNAVDKILNANASRTGPAFIYTYVPLNESEQHAPNVVRLEKDPFRIQE
jgi:hypothetical protein